MISCLHWNSIKCDFKENIVNVYTKLERSQAFLPNCDPKVKTCLDQELNKQHEIKKLTAKRRVSILNLSSVKSWC